MVDLLMTCPYLMREYRTKRRGSQLYNSQKFHHFAQSLIPIAACGVFLGLSAITVTMLRAEGFALGFVGPLRALLLGGAAVWSIVLAWKIAGLGAAHHLRRLTATIFVALAAATATGSWVVYFWVWQ